MRLLDRPTFHADQALATDRSAVADPPWTLHAATFADIDDVRVLFREYIAWLQRDLCFQSFEEELRALPGRYAPPSGRMTLARHANRLVGCVALRAIEPGVAEMKRLFVRPEARGSGTGRALAIRTIEDARIIGYRIMRLDTLRIPSMEPANRLYDALGFQDIPAYYPNPLPEVRYLELSLTPA